MTDPRCPDNLSEPHDISPSTELSIDKQRQRTREAWARSAVGWGSHWATIESMGADLTRAMLAQANLRPGLRILDVATGIGEPAISAARAVGPTGQVTAVDSSGEMLRHARERARRLGVTNLSYVKADMEELPDGLPSDHPEIPTAFDAAFSRFGLMFAIDPDDVLERLRGCLATGGRLVLAIWGPRDHVPLINIPTRAVAEIFEQPPPSPEQPGPFRFSDPTHRARLLQSLRRSKFERVEELAQDVVLDLESPEAFAEFSLATSSRSRALLESHPEKRDDYVHALLERTRNHVTSNGRARLINRAFLISAVAS